MCKAALHFVSLFVMIASTVSILPAYLSAVTMDLDQVDGPPLVH